MPRDAFVFSIMCTVLTSSGEKYYREWEGRTVDQAAVEVEWPPGCEDKQTKQDNAIIDDMCFRRTK